MNTVSGFLKYVVIRALLRDAGLICDSSDSDFGLYDVNGTSWCETYFGEFNITHNVNKQLPARSYQLHTMVAKEELASGYRSPLVLDK